MTATRILTVFPFNFYFEAKNHYLTDQIFGLLLNHEYNERDFFLDSDINYYIKQTLRNNYKVYFYLGLNGSLGVWERVGPSPLHLTLHNNSQDDLEQDNTQEDPLLNK